MLTLVLDDIGHIVEVEVHIVAHSAFAGHKAVGVIQIVVVVQIVGAVEHIEGVVGYIVVECVGVVHIVGRMWGAHRMNVHSMAEGALEGLQLEAGQQAGGLGA